jgi:beta-glucosidase
VTASGQRSTERGGDRERADPTEAPPVLAALPPSGFPTDFRCGVTQSSVGAEGAAPTADWFAWERSGRVPRSSTGNGWATTFRTDAEVLHSVGFTDIRLTLEWARLEPTAGHVDEKRVEHDRLVLQAMRDAGLKPWATLCLGSLPGWFADDEGGFRDARARNSFWLRHVDRCGEWFGDLVEGWVPIDDPIGWALRSHLLGTRPPGIRDPEKGREAIMGAIEANHHAWRLLKSGGKPIMAVFDAPTVHRDGAEAKTEANHWDRVLWRTWVGAIRDGLLTVPGGPELEREDMQGAFDVIGLRFDHPLLVRADGSLGPYPKDAAVDASGFAPNAEELGHALRRAADDLPGRRLMIAGNGVATTSDSWREELVHETVHVLRQAVADGVPLDGYFHDTGIDGYEWRRGFDAPRGLIERDRTPKASGRALQMLIAGESEA